MASSSKFCSCGEIIEQERYNLGIFICLTCGESKAFKQKQQMAKSIVPAYSKGAYVYIRDKRELKQLDPKHKL